MIDQRTLREEKEKLRHALEKEILPQVIKPGRYINKELNAVHKDWEKTPVRVALGYPDTYEIGMANLGLMIFYEILNQKEEVMAERVFTPWADLAERLRTGKLPLFSLESWTPLKYFDLLCLTVPSELNYTNILEMLDLAGLPLLSRDRDGSHPLVIGGGPAMANPEPIADFFDALVIGEGEEVLLEIVEVVAEHQKKAGCQDKQGKNEVQRQKQRQELLARLAAIPGVYIPSFYQVEHQPDGRIARMTARPPAPARVVKRYAEKLDDALMPIRPIVPYLEVVHQRVGLEIMRGCPHHCRFCQAKVFYHPLRFRSLPDLYQSAEEALKNTGYDEISLVSLSSTDHPGIEELAETLARRYGPKKVSVALPSSRADSYSIALAASTQKTRQTGITMAPETGSERLRWIIGKRISQAEILDAVRTALDKGVNSLKLYFMVGLPRENEADLEALIGLVEEIYRLGKASRGQRFNLAVSLAPFVPKPSTPFQWVEQEPVDKVKQKLDHIKRKLRRRGLAVRWGDPQLSWLEGILTRGDRRLAQVVRRAWENGAKFDAWVEFFNWDRWRQALSEEGLSPEFYIRARGVEELLPWDHLDLGVKREYFWQQYQQALTEERIESNKDK